MLDLSEEDGQDEGMQRRAAAQTVSDPRQGERGVLEAQGGPVTADTLAENIFSLVSGAQWDTGRWLESWFTQVCERTTCARLLAKAISVL